MLRRRIFPLLLFATLMACANPYKPTEIRTQWIALSDTLSADEPAISRLLAPYRDSLSQSMNEVIGYSAQTMYSTQPQGLLGNFTADLVYAEITGDPRFEFLRQETCVALLNTRGLRTSLPEGEIHRGRVFEIMPFDNAIVLLRLDTTALRKMGEYLAAVGGHPVSRNVRLLVENAEVRYFHIDGQAPTRDCWVITSDYLADGGDRMYFLGEAIERKETGIRLRDLILQHIISLTATQQPAQALIDERIVIR